MRSKDSLLPYPIRHSRNSGRDMVDLGQGFSVPNQYEGAQSFKHLRFAGTNDGDRVACNDL